MRIILVMSEASLWKPQFVQSLAERLPKQHNIIGAVLTGFRPRGVSYLGHLRRYLVMLGPWVFAWMAVREIYHFLVDRAERWVVLPQPHSIAGVCRRRGIPIFQGGDINSTEVVSWIKELEPDVLLSSGNQIFGQELLSTPRVASLNRHTSLLPAYRGIYPLFWCLLNQEAQVGVSVHTMTEDLDGGIVLAQQALQVEPHDTFFSLFAQCFELSVDVVIGALCKLEKGDFRHTTPRLRESYYSYPCREDVRKFRALGRRML